MSAFGQKRTVATGTACEKVPCGRALSLPVLDAVVSRRIVSAEGEGANVRVLQRGTFGT